MARSVGSTFDGVLPIGKGKPPVWHHEVLRSDGTPYRKSEVDLIRQLTGKQ